MKTGTPQLKALYSMEIVDHSVSMGNPTDTNKVLEYLTSRFTPIELYGYYKSGRILTFNSNIVDVDLESYNESNFVVRYFDKRTYNIYVITINKNKEITKKLDYQLFTVIEIADSNFNNNGGSYSNPLKSFYTPLEISTFLQQGKTIKYNNSALNTDYSISGKDTYYGYFFNDKNTPCSIKVDSNKNIEIEEIIAESETTENDNNILLDILDKNDRSKSAYTPSEMIDLSKTKIFTYDGNIINTDLTLSNDSLYVGFYMDGFTMSVYRVTVDANKNFKYSTYKKIIRQIEIFNTNHQYDSFTIDGAIDNLDYYIKDVKNLYFVWDTARHFETWVTIDAEHYDCNLHFPSNTQWIRDEDLEPEGIERGRKRELSIKDGIIVSAPVGEEWIDFD